MDASGAIRAAYEVYARNYRSVLVPFVVLVLLTAGSSIALEVIKYAGAYMEPDCASQSLEAGADMGPILMSMLVCELSKPSVLIRFALNLLLGFVLIIVLFSAIKPLEDILLSRPVSDWGAGLRRQTSNGVQYYVLEIATGFISIAPVIVVALLVVPGALDMFSQGEAGRSELVSELLPLLLYVLLALSACIVISTVLTLFLTFVRVELVLEGKGVLAAVRNSFSLVGKNFWGVFLFHFIWLLLSFLAGLAVLVTCCFALFVGPIVTYLLVTPVRLLSEIIYWRELKYGKSDYASLARQVVPKRS